MSLRRDGLVLREAYDERSPRVQHSVWTSGRSCCNAFDGLLAWAVQHAMDVRAARRRFDEER